MLFNDLLRNGLPQSPDASNLASAAMQISGPNSDAVVEGYTASSTSAAPKPEPEKKMETASPSPDPSLAEIERIASAVDLAILLEDS